MSAQSSQLINGFVINYTKGITIFVFVAQDGTRCHIRSVNHARTDGDVTWRRHGKGRRGKTRRGNKSCWLADTFVSFSCSSAQVLPAVNCLISFLWNAALSLSLTLTPLLYLSLSPCTPPLCCDIVAAAACCCLWIFMASSCHFHNVAFDTFPLAPHTPAVPRPALHRTAPPRLLAQSIYYLALCSMLALLLLLIFCLLNDICSWQTHTTKGQQQRRLSTGTRRPFITG